MTSKLLVCTVLVIIASGRTDNYRALLSYVALEKLADHFIPDISAALMNITAPAQSIEGAVNLELPD